MDDPELEADIRKAIDSLKNESLIRVASVIDEMRAGHKPQYILGQMRAEVTAQEEEEENTSVANRLKLVS